MPSYLAAAFAVLSLCYVGSTTAFTVKMTSEPSRRTFFKKVAGTTAGVVGSTFLQTAEPANALGGGLKTCNAKLSSYGLPAIKNVPSGFSPLVEVYGKGRNREPLLVSFVHPLDWIVTLPSQDVNGEDGTIQAGEYAKGDTATFYLLPDSGKVQNLSEQPKDFFKNAISKAISQKGDSIYQDFKITKVEPVKGDYNDQQYVICDFKYTLLTGAGFEVDRQGVASVTSEGKSVEVLWAASTRQRYKKLEENLRSIAGSFRVYSEGLNLSSELMPENEF
mmetsp:Transcript_17623/g.24285  ORF Transcript_17623/g.24285 Transcript_17623/m.24285 type:complete len:277 (-) Transcript_17623:355-1185(-)|eukprot:CAMPEP_0185723380 /NCGR_PEP_ID=MMETSP1171-20130828/230_1 /TAXON_ID=374046 /ORGANISM="Helicotheca tamensis, Strain CCMP826" /LENGTH=276 /DNA_ID=CAMNT_0028391077 /DNA_START=135 /DNA_END=965 /DNA_ORIENTATION=+